MEDQILSTNLYNVYLFRMVLIVTIDYLPKGRYEMTLLIEMDSVSVR